MVIYSFGLLVRLVLEVGLNQRGRKLFALTRSASDSVFVKTFVTVHLV